jgi:hypothetical protein
MKCFVTITTFVFDVKSRMVFFICLAQSSKKSMWFFFLIYIRYREFIRATSFTSGNFVFQKFQNCCIYLTSLRFEPTVVKKFILNFHFHYNQHFYWVHKVRIRETKSVRGRVSNNPSSFIILLL